MSKPKSKKTVFVHKKSKTGTIFSTFFALFRCDNKTSTLNETIIPCHIIDFDSFWS